jgi:hypothetical protein
VLLPWIPALIASRTNLSAVECDRNVFVERVGGGAEGGTKLLRNDDSHQLSL